MKIRNAWLVVLIGLILVAGAVVAFAEQAASTGPGYTETPALDKIPTGLVSGVVNGRTFEAKAVYFQPSFGKWAMVISDKPLPEPTGLVFDNQSFNMNLPEPPAAGKKYSHPFGFGDGYLQVQKSDKEGDTTSWNTDNAWVLEITKWDVKPYDEKGKMFQQAGTASGRVYITYGGGTDIKASWVAGTFTDVPVRYMGKPEMDK